MSWLGAIGSIFSWLAGDTIAASLVRVVIGVGVMRYLSGQQNGDATGSTSTPQGVRQQISPATDNKLPVAYGDSYFGGTVIDVQMSNQNKELYAVIALCEQTGDLFSSNPGTPSSRTASVITIDDVYLNNQRITFKADGTTIDYTTDDTGVQDSNSSGLVGIYLYQGNSNSPMLPCQTGTTTPIAGSVPAVAYSIMPGWGSSHSLQNTIFAIVKMNYDPSKGQRSIPALKFHVRNTLNKPGDVLHDYMTNVMYGGGLEEAMIDSASITALNTYSDALVTYPPYSAQKRYTVNGLIRTTESVMSNMERIAGTAGSYVTYDISTGKWGVLINKVTAKSLDFNDSNIIGQIALTGTALDSFYNSVEVQFPYAYLKDQMNFVRVDLPEVYRSQNEPDNQLQITHELTNNIVQASILANLDLRQSREDLTVVFSTDYSKFNTQVGDVVGITNSVYGWTNKLFRVVRLKRNDSEDGRLTLEITAQAYNDDVYTVEDISDFIPNIGAGHSIPNLGAIAKPNAPIVTTGSTISNQPSISLTATIPTGVVTEMEFWYTRDDTEPNDNLRNYILLGTTRAENSGPFTTGQTTTFKTVLLQTDSYYFKVRAANQYGTSAFSNPSSKIDYTFTAAPDVLPYVTPVVNGDGGPSMDGFNMGLLALYLASKLNWGGLWDDILAGTLSLESLADLFGLSSANAASTVATVTSEAAAQAAAAQSAADAAQAAADAAQAAADAAEAAGDAADAAGDALDTAANLTSNVFNVSTTTHGHVFPNLFGSGPDIGMVDTRAAIFTHDHLVYGKELKAQMRSDNVIQHTASTISLKPSVNGQIQNFYNIPEIALGGFSQKPFYDENATDKFTANTSLTLYYSLATYSSGDLDDQSWGPWIKIDSDNGVRLHYADNVTECTTNPVPPCGSDYVVEVDIDCDGVGTITSSAYSYNPFYPNVTLERSETLSTRTKELCVTADGTYVFTLGPNNLIAFGLSVYNLPSGSAFNNNTIFGHVGDYLTVFGNTPALKSIATSGSTFVAVTSGTVYYSSNGTQWNKITKDDLVTENPQWLTGTNETPNCDNISVPVMKKVIWDGSKFILYGEGNRVATSTNGKNWTQVSSTQGISADTQQIAAASGKYVAVGPLGVQNSTNGSTWTTPSKPSLFGGTSFSTVVHDGSKFYMGGRYAGGASQTALASSTDGVNWSKVDGVSNPKMPQKLNEAQYNAVQGNVNAANTSTVGALP
jgi:hypothetical protein